MAVDVAMEQKFGRSVSIDQAAALLNVSRRTIYNRIRDGRLQTIRTLGGSQRVLVESLYDLGFRPQAFSTSASAASVETIRISVFSSFSLRASRSRMAPSKFS